MNARGQFYSAMDGLEEIYRRDYGNEPEDWFERNEHGDFDNY